MNLLGRYLKQVNIVHGQEKRQDMVLIYFYLFANYLTKEISNKTTRTKKIVNMISWIEQI